MWDSLSFLDDQGIELRRPSGGDEETDNLSSLMSEAEVLSALQVILSPQNYPLHVMCKFGHHRTGTVIGCLRKLQGWNLTAIFEEYRRYAGSKVRFLNEQFIELFDTDLVRIPVDHPAWLWNPDIQSLFFLHVDEMWLLPFMEQIFFNCFFNSDHGDGSIVLV